MSAPCPLLNAFNATFPSTAVGGTGGACNVGFAGTIQASCLLNATTFQGYWAAPTGSCTLIQCPRNTYSNAVWPAIAPYGVDIAVVGTCVAGAAPLNLTQSTLRVCHSSGSYDAVVTNPCIQGFCASATFGHASWPQTPAGQLATGLCDLGWQGAPTGTCGVDGAWLPTVAQPCTQTFCPLDTASLADPAFQASFPVTAALATAVGTCAAGLYGRPQRLCTATGIWAAALVNNPCSAVTCPALVLDGNANWTAGVPGVSANGRCVDGWTGTPTRLCTTAGWGAVASPCTAAQPTAAPTGTAAAPTSTPAVCDAGFTPDPTSTLCLRTGAGCGAGRGAGHGIGCGGQRAGQGAGQVMEHGSVTGRVGVACRLPLPGPHRTPCVRCRPHLCLCGPLPTQNHTACPVGQYKSASGNANCSACPFGATTLANGSDAFSACVCQPGYTGPNANLCFRA